MELLIDNQTALERHLQGLCRQFAGMEIIRRLLVVARLPSTASTGTVA